MTTEQTTTQPTAPTVNWNNLRCLYAEDIKDEKGQPCKVKCKIAGIRNTPDDSRLFCNNQSADAFDIALFIVKKDGSLSYADKDGRTRYIQIPKLNKNGKRANILRSYVIAVGSEPEMTHVGKSIILYTEETKKSKFGKAIRIADVNE